MTDTAAVESVATLSAEDVGWMMRSIRDATSRIAEEKATHARYLDRLEDETRLVLEAEERATKEDRDKIAYLEAQLTAHLLNKRAADPNCKSVKTPWGVIESREVPAEYVRDDAVLLDWCRKRGEHGEKTYVRAKTTYAPDWEAMKAAFKVNGSGQMVTEWGEVVPGVTVVEKPLKVTVKVQP